MTRTLKTTAIAAALIAGTVSTSFAASNTDATVKELLSAGYSESVVSQLTDAQLNTISAALHGGSNSDARQDVRSLVFHFTN